MIFCQDCKFWRFIRENEGECNKIDETTEGTKAYLYAHSVDPNQEIVLLTKKDFGCNLAEEKNYHK